MAANYGGRVDLSDALAAVPAWVWPTVVAAVLGGVAAVIGQRVSKRLDRRAYRVAARRRRRDRDGQALRLHHRRVTTPAWTVGHQLDGYVDLEYRGDEVAHRVRVEVLDARRARMVTRQTIEVATLPRGMPISIPLGAVERARLYAIAVE